MNAPQKLKIKIQDYIQLIFYQIGKQVLNFGNSGTEPKTQLVRYLKYNKDYNFDELIYFFLPQNDYSSPEKIDEDSQKTISKENNSKIISLGNLKYKIFNFLSRFTYSYNFIRSFAYTLDINFNYGYENLSYFYKDKLNIDYTFRYLEKIINSKKVNSFIIIIPTIYDINNFQKKKNKL